MVDFGEFLKTWNLRSNSVTRQVTFDWKKIGEKCQNGKIENATFSVIIKHFGNVSFEGNIWIFPPKLAKIVNFPIRDFTLLITLLSDFGAKIQIIFVEIIICIFAPKMVR